MLRRQALSASCYGVNGCLTQTPFLLGCMVCVGVDDITPRDTTSIEKGQTVQGLTDREIQIQFLVINWRFLLS